MATRAENIPVFFFFFFSQYRAQKDKQNIGQWQKKPFRTVTFYLVLSGTVVIQSVLTSKLAALCNNSY